LSQSAWLNLKCNRRLDDFRYRTRKIIVPERFGEPTHVDRCRTTKIGKSGDKQHWQLRMKIAGLARQSIPLIPGIRKSVTSRSNASLRSFASASAPELT